MKPRSLKASASAVLAAASVLVFPAVASAGSQSETALTGEDFTFSPVGDFTGFPYTATQTGEPQTGAAQVTTPCTDGAGSELVVTVEWTPLSTRALAIPPVPIDFAVTASVPSTGEDPIAPDADVGDGIKYSFVTGQAGIPDEAHTATVTAPNVTAPSVDINLALTRSGIPDVLAPGDSMSIESVKYGWTWSDTDCPPPPPPNSPPVAVDDTLTVTGTTPGTVDVLANDTDPDAGDTLSVASVTDPPNGTAVQQGGGVIQYTANPKLCNGKSGATLSDLFTYTVTDGKETKPNTDTATVRVTIECPVIPPDPNVPPVLQPDTINVNAGDTAPADVLANDTDPDGGPAALSIVSASVPGVRTQIIGGKSLLVTPNPGVCGTQTGRYTATDGADPVTVALTVDVTCPTPDANQPPQIPVFPSQSLDPGATASFDVLGGATDPEGDRIFLVSTSADRGQATIDGNNIVYTAPDKCGDDTVTYVASDGTTEITRVLSIGVICEGNKAPTANPDKATVGCEPEVINVLRNDTDPDGDALSVPTASATGGLAEPDGKGRVIYTSGKDTVSDRADYEISDGRGGLAGSAIEITSTCPDERPGGIEETLQDLGLLAPKVAEADSPLCADLGVSDISEGDPLYDPALDYDDDGIACETTADAPTGDSPANGDAPTGDSPASGEPSFFAPLGVGTLSGSGTTPPPYAG